MVHEFLFMSMGGKFFFVFLVVILIVGCMFCGWSDLFQPGDSLNAEYLNVEKSISHLISGNYYDSDTLEYSWSQSYELCGDNGKVFNIHYEGSVPADLMIFDSDNNNLYNHALENFNLYLNFYGKIYKNVQKKDIKFIQPDDSQYYFIIDNTELVHGGADSGKALKYILSAS
ncbi:MAG: hypothetical protein PHP13_05550 [Methanomicrobium sp.]|nr:hypothetical protein [Methanomicrobium sp.]MDD4126182.1 hypothetical protein [Methanomicrobium sp.]